MTPQRMLKDSLVRRLEQAYRLRHPDWRDSCRSDRVWSVAANILIEVNVQDPSIPVDPELYVAAQPLSTHWADPWAELACPAAARRFRRQVRQMILTLRNEIRREVRRAEAKMRHGIGVESVLLPSNHSLTALGCFIVAHRAGRADLAWQFSGLVEEQHQACPLYRQAARGLLPHQLYPEVEEKSVESFGLIPSALRMVPAYLN